METCMRVGEVAAAAGVSTRALRYYEQHGLLAAERTASGQRRYSADAVDRVRWIQELFAAGLNSHTVRELLPCVHDGFVTSAMVERLRRERDRVDEQVHSLSATRDRLDSVLTDASSRQAEPAG